MKKILLPFIIFYYLMSQIVYANALAPASKLQEFDSSGAVCNGCYLYTYDTGTTTPRATKVSKSGASNTNPIILDSNGRANVWIDTTEYRFVLKESDDSTTVYTVDNVSAIPDTGTFSDLTVTGISVTDLDGVINIGNRYYVDATESDVCSRSSGYPTTLKTITDYIDNIGSSKKAILVLAHSTSSNNTAYTCSSNETLPYNIAIEYENGAVLTDDASNATFTHKGEIIATDTQQIFDWTNGTGVVDFSAGTNVEYASICWWGIPQDSSATATANSTAINECISSGHKNIFVPTGLWYFNSSIAFTPGSSQRINFYGTGYGSRIDLATSSNTDLISVDNDGDNFTIRNMRLVGGHAGQTSGDLLQIDQVHNMLVENIWFEDWKDYAINSSSNASNGVTINKCKFITAGSSTDYGVKLAGTQATITNNNFESINNNAITGSATIQSGVIVGNYFENNSGSELIGGFQGCLISGNYFNSNVDPIIDLTGNSSNNVITGNSVGQTTAISLVKFNGASVTDNIESNNFISGSVSSATWTNVNGNKTAGYEKIACSAKLSGNQTVATATTSILAVVTEEYDYTAIYTAADSTFDAPENGLYEVTVQVGFNNLADTVKGNVAVYKNDTGAVSTGTLVLQAQGYATAADDDPVFTATKTLLLVEDDTLRPQVFHTGGGNEDIEADASATFFQVRKVN